MKKYVMMACMSCGMFAAQTGNPINVLSRDLAQLALASRQATARFESPIIINESNTYTLGNGGSQIQINASNVMLNLNGFTINTNGITVAPGLENIVIYNGVIDDITFPGVGISIGEGCSNVTISNLVIKNSPGITAIGIYGVSGTECYNIKLDSILISNAGLGVDVNYTNKINLNYVSVSDVANITSIGINLQNCISAMLTACQVVNVGIPASDSSFGYRLSEVTNGALINCVAQNISGGNTQGIGISSCSCTQLENVKCLNIHENAASGVAVLDSENISIQNSQFVCVNNVSSGAAIFINTDVTNTLIQNNIVVASTLGYFGDGTDTKAIDNFAAYNDTDYTLIPNIATLGDLVCSTNFGDNISA